MIGFWIVAVVSVVGAIGVVTLRQPVHAALALVGTLLAVAVAYLQLQAHFLAATQVIIYAGAIMVLFLFVIMLLNVTQREVGDRLRWIRPAAGVVGAITVLALAATVLAVPQELPGADVVAGVFQGAGATGIADTLFTRYLLAFQLVGVLLLTGIVGAVGLVQRSPSAAADEQARSGMPDRTPGAPPPADRRDANPRRLEGGR
ncbi:MAG: NADH-quinone oxidoreductase subunit J [Trueperaceae bacterium]|nr:NADH-quinone oxidoreductase subunit J [Trueperaceae bacterium]